MNYSYNELEKKKEVVIKYKSIWIDSRDANSVTSDRKQFTFDKLPLIVVKKNTKSNDTKYKFGK